MADVNVPIDVLLQWHFLDGLPDDWARTAAQWPGVGPAELSAEPPTIHAVVASLDGVTVGLHLATMRRPGQMSTLWCGVDPSVRGHGLAQRLIARHLQWAANEGRHEVRAHTPARCRAMVVANLKAGFEVAGSFTDPSGEVMLILHARPV